MVRKGKKAIKHIKEEHPELIADFIDFIKKLNEEVELERIKDAERVRHE